MAVTPAAKSAKPSAKKAPANPALTLASRLSQKYGVTESQIISWLADYGPGLTRSIVALYGKRAADPSAKANDKKIARAELTGAKRALALAVVADCFAV